MSNLVCCAFGGLILGACVLNVGPAEAGGVLDRYTTQGCAIAPDATRPEQAQRALSNGMAQEHAGWMVLGAEVCTMVPPTIQTKLNYNDPDVAPYISEVDAYADAPGCFLDAQAMQGALVVTRGWSEEEAFSEYLRMIGAGIFSGEWRFFHESPLHTPVGFQLMTGACADVPAAKQMRASHADMIASFDPYIRATAFHLACAEGEGYVPPNWAQIYSGLGQGAIENAWQGFEVGFALMAAGWVEGVSLTDKGAPRPPLCVPPQMVKE